MSLSGYGADPRKKSSGVYVNPTQRRCPMCGKILTIIQLAQNSNRTPCCHVLVLS